MAIGGALLIGGLQAGIGALQRRAARRRRERALENFEYKIPGAMDEMLDMATLRASRNQIPGASDILARTESDIASTLARGEAVADAPSDVLGLYAKMFGAKQDISRDLAIKGAEYKSANELQLMKTLGLYADAQNQQFMYNRYLPFIMDMQYATQDAQGGSANVAAGLQTAYGTWMNQWMMDEYKKLFAMNRQGTTPGSTPADDLTDPRDANAPILPDYMNTPDPFENP